MPSKQTAYSAIPITKIRNSLEIKKFCSSFVVSTKYYGNMGGFMPPFSLTNHEG